MKKNAKSERPSFQFYPNDWLGDHALQTCSPKTIGVFSNLMCLMHKCRPYGHLSDPNSNPLSVQKISRLCLISVSILRSSLYELERNTVLKRNQKGVLYSKRMVGDERLRVLRSEAGKSGGNPNLVNQEDNQEDNQNGKQNSTTKVKQKQTPSSSSSSSSSISLKKQGVQKKERENFQEEKNLIREIVEKVFKCRKEWTDVAEASARARLKRFKVDRIVAAFENLEKEPDLWQINNNGWRPLSFWLKNDDRILNMEKCHLKGHGGAIAHRISIGSKGLSA